MARLVWELFPLDARGVPSEAPAVRVDTPEAFAAAVSFYCSEGSAGFSFRRVEVS